MARLSPGPFEEPSNLGVMQVHESESAEDEEGEEDEEDEEEGGAE